MAMTEDKRTTRTPKVSLNVRVEADQVAWLTQQAIEHDSSVSMELRSLIWSAMEEVGAVEVEHVTDLDGEQTADLISERELEVDEDRSSER